MKSKASLFLCVVFAGSVIFLWQSGQVHPRGDFAFASSVSAQEPVSSFDRRSFSNNSSVSKEVAVEPVVAVYLTSWSAGTKRSIDRVMRLSKTTQVNAVVIDIKDFSGYVAYRSRVPDVAAYKAQGTRIRHIRALLRRLHKQGLYVIGRVVVFQDPVLARARPDLAIHSKSRFVPEEGTTSSSLWRDELGLFWVDPASQEVWEYIVSLGQEASDLGFDEINFDYIRFPSDGDLADMYFPVWDTHGEKRVVIREFFVYLREQLPDIPLSVDLFGLTTVSRDDLGIGQLIEDAYEYFDYISPMVYPSHYEQGFLGFDNPAAHPYEVVRHSMDAAVGRLKNYELSITNQESEEGSDIRSAKLRPWLQDFDLGAQYDAQMVREEIRAVADALGDDFHGFMLWSPANVYTEDALRDTVGTGTPLPHAHYVYSAPPVLCSVARIPHSSLSSTLNGMTPQSQNDLRVERRDAWRVRNITSSSPSLRVEDLSEEQYICDESPFDVAQGDLFETESLRDECPEQVEGSKGYRKEMSRTYLSLRSSEGTKEEARGDLLRMRGGSIAPTLTLLL